MSTKRAWIIGTACFFELVYVLRFVVWKVRNERE